MKTVFKPWGKEEWLELNDRYCYKRIYINAGYKTSYQYHNQKRETNYIISGEAEVWLENDEGVVEKKLMKAGEYFNVTPPKKHRVIALTDIILQEVSTPEVDDVVRLEDDTNRVSGKIQGEHETPGVLILAAGKGVRLRHLTAELNKGLLPIGNEAIISKIIKKFPKDYKFVIAVGYKGNLIQQYCDITFPDRDITYIEIDDIDSDNSGPGYSALKCKEHLQRPFYLTTVDCLLSSDLPYLDGNWLGVHTTSYPEKYSTALVENGIVKKFVNKAANGYDQAFIGLAGILDYSIFWTELENNISKGEIVTAFESPDKYPILKSKTLEWFDTGNLDDLEKARLFFKDTPLSLNKTTSEILYKDSGKVIKFFPNTSDVDNLYTRAQHLKRLTPNNVAKKENFLYYDWEDGDTLYKLDNFGLYTRFIENYLESIDKKDPVDGDLKTFYIDKTEDRINKFLTKNGEDYFTTEYIINKVKHASLDSIIKNLKLGVLKYTIYNKNFHGDLQFDNIIYNNGVFKYIDWRRNFGESLDSGDVYYDLGKMYGGILIPYSLMKDENNINFTESSSTCEFTYETLPGLKDVESEFKYLVEKHGFDFDKINLITGLIYLNMACMHEGKFSKLLWFKAITTLSTYGNK